jgi:quercetin dioxygenase-like cupin family protein
MSADEMDVLREGEGDSVSWPGFGARFMLGGERTEGRVAVVEHPIGPRSLAAPMHTHTHEDEYTYVVEGRVGVQIGDRTLEAAPGDMVFKPRGVPHAFWNATDEPARVLEIISPAGFESYFAELAPILGSGGPPDLERLAEVRERYDLDMDVSSIERLSIEHGLGGPKH